jgi:hypothetical protein
MLDTAGNTVQYADFVVEATFSNPPTLKPDTVWSYGFGFRDTGEADDQFRLYVSSDKHWELFWGPTGAVVQSGYLAEFDTSANASCTLSLVARGNEGVFYLNGSKVSELDLSKRTGTGQIFVGSGFIYGDTPGVFIYFEGFKLWRLY